MRSDVGRYPNPGKEELLQIPRDEFHGFQRNIWKTTFCHLIEDDQKTYCELLVCSSPVENYVYDLRQAEVPV